MKRHPRTSFSNTRTLLLPTDVATWGLNTVLFQDSMTDPSTFDLANVLDTSKNWFIKNTWASSLDWPNSLSPTSPANLSITPNGTSILVSNNDNGWDYASAADDGHGGHIGKTFSLPFYIEFEVKVDPADAIDANNNTSLAAVWMLSSRLLENTVPNGNPIMENDLFEAIVQTAPTFHPVYTIHQWDVENGIAVSDNHNSNNFSSTNIDNFWHKIGLLYVSSTLNSGVGFRKVWIDGVNTGDFDLSWGPSQEVSPGVSGTNSNGLFTTLDTESFVLINGSTKNAKNKVRNFLIMGA